MITFKNSTIPQLLHARHADCLDSTAQMEKDADANFQPITFGEMWKSIQHIAGGLTALKVKPGDRIVHISDNRSEWLHVCLAINSIGAIDVPSGTDTTKGELKHIIEHSDPTLCILETAKLYDTIAGSTPKKIAFIITDNSKASVQSADRHTLYNLDEVKSMDSFSDEDFIQRITQGKPEDVATIIYTSGTTGTSKGVMLSHRNFTFQLEILSARSLIVDTDTVLCVLPVWHSFERIANILGSYSRAILAYSKPVASILVADMAKVKPTIMASVPRIWEAIRTGVLKAMKSAPAIRRSLFHFFLSIGYASSHLKNIQHDLIARIKKRPPNGLVKLGVLLGSIVLFPLNALGNILVFKKLQGRLGGRFRAGVSGAGALNPTTYAFFQAVGISLCEGYGLTETAPVVAINVVGKNKSGTVGRILDKIDYKILHPDGSECSVGDQGELVIKSEQVMRGYYKNEENTKKVLSDDGWFCTGDLVVETDQRDIKILGRLKDTIVLSSGKNVEPAPIEDVLSSSPYIDTAFVVGQDKNRLAALLFVNKDAITEYAKEEKITHASLEELCGDAKLLGLFSDTVNSLVNTQNGFHPYELISRFHILTDELTVGVELGKTLKLKRFVLTKKYKDIIEALFTK